MHKSRKVKEVTSLGSGRPEDGETSLIMPLLCGFTTLATSLDRSRISDLRVTGWLKRRSYHVAIVLAD